MPETTPEPSGLLHTPLHRVHREAGATMTPFAGWEMPLRYTSDLAEHAAVRERAGLFDLSHMAQLEVSGPGAPAALDHALVTRPSAMRVGRARYSLLVAGDGGILDDLIVYRLAETEYLVIANAANRTVVLDELTGRSEQAAEGVHVADRTPSRALIALQGPVSPEMLRPLTTLDDGRALDELPYYAAAPATVAGLPVLLARTGYTGETGYELSVPEPSAVALWETLRSAGEEAGVLPCGLACRDTLRLEAGMPLYGNELSRGTTPYEVGLGRVVHLGHDFVGREALSSLTEPERVLVGLAGEGRRAARAGSTVHDAAGELGVVTSGVLSPTLGHPVAMALVAAAAERVAPGAVLDVEVRGRRQPMTVTDLPFYRRPSRS